MTDLMILVKNNARVFWGSIKNRKKARYAASGALMAGVVILVGFFLVAQSLGQVFMMKEAGVPELAIFSALISALTLGILFSLMRAAGPMVIKDAELLLAMPVKRTTVVLSKLLTQYIFDAPLMIGILGSSIIAYVVINDAGVLVLIRGLILTFILPLFPMALAQLVGAGLFRLQQKFKSTSIVSTAILMVLFVGYMALSLQTSKLYSVAEGMNSDMLPSIFDRVAPLGYLTRFVLYGNLTAILFSLVMILIPFALGVMVYSRDFGQTARGYRSKNKHLSFAVKSPKRAMLHKEKARYLECSIYVFNTAFSPLIMIILTGAILFLGSERIFSSMSIPASVLSEFSATNGYILLVGILSATVAIASTTASSISLEGNSFWIVKALPVAVEDVFFGKYMLNILLVSPVAFLCGLLAGLRLGASPIEAIGLGLVPALMGVCTAFLGLICNLFFPRFDWTSETAVVKQSMSVLLTMLLGVIVVAVPFVLFFTVVPSHSLAAFLATGILCYAGISILLYLFLKTKGKKMFLAL